jgi:DNA repair protein RecN (Recombination protein N)
MLTRLVINDVVLIDKLALTLAPGLNVLSGETGAGKSILLDALGLALGERGEASLLRTGAQQAAVTAEFDLPPNHAVFALAAEQGLTCDAPLILRRTIAKDGKSRAFINDQPISIGLLRQFGARLLEMHGQFETHGLLNPSTHRGLLDAYGGLVPLRDKTAAAFAAWKQTEAAASAAAEASARAAAEADFLRAAVAELDQLAPEPGETDRLAERRGSLQHREKIFAALTQAADILDGERGGIAMLTQAAKAVARVADKAEALPNILSALDRAIAEAIEAGQQLAHVNATLDAEPDTLQRIEERLFSLRATARKHNVLPEALPDLRRDLSSRLGLLGDQEGQLRQLAKQAAAARQAYLDNAATLSAERRQAASMLEKAVMRELPPLKLERAQFKIDIAALTEEQAAADGMDRVIFLASTNPGSPAGPLQKVASGGELARFMLALKVVLAAADPVPVLVFDEVDAGIGGATASAVGERLADLADMVQVLVITHSPQVAARGTHHLRVIKRVKGKHMTTDVEVLDQDARREEIARMLAGSHITDAARQAAASLLDDAVPEPKSAAAPKRRIRRK